MNSGFNESCAVYMCTTNLLHAHTLLKCSIHYACTVGTYMCIVLQNVNSYNISAYAFCILRVLKRNEIHVVP